MPFLSSIDLHMFVIFLAPDVLNFAELNKANYRRPNGVGAHKSRPLSFCPITAITQMCD